MSQMNPFEETETQMLDDTEDTEDGVFRGTDLQERFGQLLLAYNAAHLDLLEASRVARQPPCPSHCLA